MQIEVSKIKSTIIEDSFSMNNMEIINSHNEKIKVNSISGKYKVYRIDESDFHLKINFNAEFTLPCSSCTEDFTFRLEDNFSTIYTNKEDYTEGEVTLKDADLDMKFFNEDILDLESEITNNILLLLPISPVCSENCKGLCSNCGTNLNTGNCDCNEKNTDPRWKALETFINKE